MACVRFRRMPGVKGIVGAAKRVVAHLRALAKLEAELARWELKRKAGAFGAGAAMLAGAAVLGLFSLAFALALITAALAIVLPVWLSILIVFALVTLIAGLLGYLGTRAFKSAGAPVPTDAVEH